MFTFILLSTHHIKIFEVRCVLYKSFIQRAPPIIKSKSFVLVYCKVGITLDRRTKLNWLHNF
jgi:hypothetical protein